MTAARFPLPRLLACCLLAAAAYAQQATIGAKTRTTDSSNAYEHELGVKPEAVLRLVKLKGVIIKVDLKKRTVTIASKKKKDPPIELTFSQPAGREQIKAGKKAAKQLGKKKLRLEEVRVGAKVALEYYPVLSQMLELVVEETSGS